MITQEDMAYVAGLIDGEGTLLKQKNGKYYQAVVRITNTNLDMLKFVQGKFGGIILGPYDKGGNIPQHIWQISWYKGCELFLRMIEPYLIEKKDMAKELIEFMQNRIPRKTSMR